MSGARTALARIFRVVTKLEELCLAWGMIGIAALTIANVFARSVLGHSLTFAEEISQFLIVFVTFVGLGYGVSQGRHIRMTALYDQLPERGRKATMAFIALSTSALMFYLTYLSVDYVLGTVRVLGTVSPALQVPLWIVYLSAPLGFFLAGIQYGMTFLKNLIAEDVWISFEKRDEYDEAPPADI